MDPLTLSLLTIALNALITYFLLKRQENRYAEQIEKLRASLQYSNFEQQTKFASIHAKRVETMETLYRKFLIFADNFTESVLKALHYGLPSNEVAKINIDDFQDFDDHMEEIEDCRLYFMHNRLFLSTDTGKDVENILSRARSMSLIVDNLIFDEFENSPEMNKMINRMLKFSNFRTSELDLQKPNIALMIHEMVQHVNSDTLTLEMLYKSVADTKS